MKFNKAQIFKLKKALLRLSEAQTEEGVVLITDGDLEVGVEVFVDGEDGLTPASDGTYNYDGKTYTVEGGVVTAITEAQTEEPEPETDPQPQADPEPEPQADPEPEPQADPEPEPQADPEPETDPEPAEDVEALKTRIAELEALVEELKKKLEEPVAESVEEEMKKQEKNVSKNNMNYARLREAIREVSQKRK